MRYCVLDCPGINSEIELTQNSRPGIIVNSRRFEVNTITTLYINYIFLDSCAGLRAERITDRQYCAVAVVCCRIVYRLSDN